MATKTAAFLVTAAHVAQKMDRKARLIFADPKGQRAAMELVRILGHGPQKVVEDALRLHPFYKGKVQVLPKCAVQTFEDLAVWYTPGVAAPCRAIHADPALVCEHTNKGNSIAIVTDGTRILGLGDIGPEAGLPA